MNRVKIYRTFALHDTRKGTISVANLDEPYGRGSKPVVSIGISLKGEDEPDWKVHIPYENLNELLDSLTHIKNELRKTNS
ncbi:hypothetical protein CIG11343_1019 [Campylobacter iguaniorum]|uniref:hypothetical protein n=1 Tax=Campylobacter iguaniorum TaxID=1244531 RepID=UPI0007C95E5B|nr:hypothetical protein [Campylobacter iguaniorum]ANE36034.1 hypothetical protein CIG11343_1019 [Campylobacter iguaniorum]